MLVYTVSNLGQLNAPDSSTRHICRGERRGGWLTSGAMYSGVPHVVLHADSRLLSLEYPKSQSFTNCGSEPTSSTLSSCTQMARNDRGHLSCVLIGLKALHLNDIPTYMLIQASITINPPQPLHLLLHSLQQTHGVRDFKREREAKEIGKWSEKGGGTLISRFATPKRWQ